MKRLLVLSTWFPYPPDNGSRQRIFHLLRELSRRFRIRLVVGVQEDSPPDIPAPLSALCAEVVPVPWVWYRSEGGGVLPALRALAAAAPRSILETDNPPMRAAIAAQLAHPTDAVLVCELGMDAYLPDLLDGPPYVMEGAEVSGMERAYRTAQSPRDRLRHGLTFAKGARYWRRRLRRYGAVTAASPGEADALRRVLGDSAPPVVVVPNGVDVAAYSLPDSDAVVRGRMIYNGALTYGPNRDAVTYFVRDILPRIYPTVPDAHLWVTGRFTDEAAAEFANDPRVHLTGFLPDLRPTLASASVCVVPLQSGGGTRLKILEAWAAGVPVVSTAIGAAGLEGAAPGEHFVVADDANDFATAAAHLLTHPEEAQRLARNARSLAEARYDWRAIGAHLGDLIEGIAGASQR